MSNYPFNSSCETQNKILSAEMRVAMKKLDYSIYIYIYKDEWRFNLTRDWYNLSYQGKNLYCSQCNEIGNISL